MSSCSLAGGPRLCSLTPTPTWALWTTPTGVNTDAMVHRTSAISGQPPVTTWTTWSHVHSGTRLCAGLEGEPQGLERLGCQGRRETDRQRRVVRDRILENRDCSPQMKAFFRWGLNSGQELFLLPMTAPKKAFPLHAVRSHIVPRRGCDPAVSVTESDGHFPSVQGGESQSSI
jgi:hypothetical protein